MKMKIPTTGSGNGYYGHESNIAMVEVVEVESDDSGMNENEFAEYMWMENEEEHDKQFYKQLEEEELIQACWDAMIEDESRHHSNQQSSAFNQAVNESMTDIKGISQQMNDLHVNGGAGDIIKQSTLNPNAAEFVPAFKMPTAPSKITNKST